MPDKIIAPSAEQIKTDACAAAEEMRAAKLKFLEAWSDWLADGPSEGLVVAEIERTEEMLQEVLSRHLH